jgi:hypothetical protein
MSLELPDDILQLICVELRIAEDWATLFNCAVTSKSFAPLALLQLYRFVTFLPAPNACPSCVRELFWDFANFKWDSHWPFLPSHGWMVVHKARCALHGQTLRPSRVQKSPWNDEEAEGHIAYASEQELLVQKWSILWRSICLASMGKTMYPYHQFLRVFDVRDLENLLDDSKFTGKIAKNFFSGDLQRFHHTTKGTTRNGKTFTKLNVVPVLEGIAMTVISSTRLLEQVSGRLEPAAFRRWLPNMTRLRRLELWNGEVLADEQVHQTIYKHCPHFHALSIFMWQGTEADRQLGAFISGLPTQILTELITISNCGVSSDTCTALNKHGDSLKRLELNFNADAVPAIALLKGCTAVESLHLEIPGTIDLESAHPEVFLELVNWLPQCTQLKEINLTEFKNGPSILLPLFLADSIHLGEASLEVRTLASEASYSVKENREFHRALMHQKSLTTLRLRGDSEGVMRDDIDALVDSVIQLTNLKHLELRGVADYFSDTQLVRLFTALSNLEEVYVGGFGVSDAILPAVASLKRLRVINFVAITRFSREGLLDFVEELGPGNEGLHLSVDNADPMALLTDEEVAEVREALSEKVQGRIDYIPLRDPNVSEFEDSGSD